MSHSECTAIIFCFWILKLVLTVEIITVSRDTLLKFHETYWDNRSKHGSLFIQHTCVPFSAWFPKLDNVLPISVSGGRRRLHLEPGIGRFTWLLLHPSSFRQPNHTASSTHPFYPDGNNDYAYECRKKIWMNAQHIPSKTDTSHSLFQVKHLSTHPVKNAKDWNNSLGYVESINPVACT